MREDEREYECLLTAPLILGQIAAKSEAGRLRVALPPQFKMQLPYLQCEAN
jgi:hypothetical protein